MPAGDAGLERQTLSEQAREASLRIWNERNQLLTEVARLREQLAEWESAHSATVELRSLIESHMDMARGQWQCVAEIERLQAQFAAQQAVVDAARWIEEDGWTPATRLGLMDALTLLPAERTQAAPPKHDPPIEGESNVDHALHCVRCQSDNRRGPVGLRQAAQPEGEPR